MLLKAPAKVIVTLQSCGSGAAVYANGTLDKLHRIAEAFDANAIRLFREAAPCLAAPVAVQVGRGRKY